MPRPGFGRLSRLAGRIRAPPIVDVFLILQSSSFGHQLGFRSIYPARRPEARPRSAAFRLGRGGPP